MNVRQSAIVMIWLLVWLPIYTFGYKMKSTMTYETTLAEYIDLSTKAGNNWTYGSGLVPIQTLIRGIVLGQKSLSDIDDLIVRYRLGGNYVGVFCTAYVANLLNHRSETVNYSIKWALDFTPMFENYCIPKTQTEPDYFNMWDRVVLYGFECSRELNYSGGKWSSSNALAGFITCRDNFGKAFYRFNPDNLTFDINPIDGTRWMSVANLADCFMILYRETANQSALDYALQEWRDLNNYYWSSDTHYKYGREIRFSPVEYEWSALEVFFNFEKLRIFNGTLGNWTRVYTDLQDRYLNETWSSPQWLDKAVRHSNKGSQKRLHATLDAWMLLHTYFGNFNEGNQTNYRKMLEGQDVTQAWRALLDKTAGLYDSESCRFKIDSDALEMTDYATAEGCIALFIMGISVQSGQGLIIPKRCWGYSGEPFPVDAFRFYFSYRQIILPIYGGTTIKFMYGTTDVVYSFNESDVYRITFDSSWNTIKSVTRAGANLEPQSSDNRYYLIMAVVIAILALLLLVYLKSARSVLGRKRVGNT